MTFFSPHDLLLLSSLDWYRLGTNSAEHLLLEGFSRDYSLNLGWNNMQYIIDAALLQSILLNRTLVLPSFIYARACEFHIAACADYAAMVNRGDAVGSEEWRELPIEQQMAFRIPISVMLDLRHLRARHPVITVSEYLRLHGQDPDSESSNGSWLRESYHTYPNVFESNRTKTPSPSIIHHHWYDPSGTTRVDYIPKEMKEWGNWERYSSSDILESGGYWPFMVPTNISRRLVNATPENAVVMDWDTAKDALRSSELDPEDVLNANGWEVLHTFSSHEFGLEKTIVQPMKQVVLRSSIRGFKDDYHHVDSDVVLLAGETHLRRKPGSMRFTEDQSRASMVVYELRLPPPVLALGEILATRMRQLSGGRLWMGVHMRRGNFVQMGWVMEKTPEEHMKRIKDRLEAGRSVLAHLDNVTMYNIGYYVEPDLEQTTTPPPLPDDRFFVATDERDPDVLQVISDAGGVFLSELLEMEDRRAFGWPLMLMDVRALIEQSLLAHSAYFYGHILSSFAGRVENLRAARGADRRTALID
ncbi:hypothetical protein DFH94DRAFT_825446 [Russula ochroleuca]|uniref:O-fucosyltransferase family protein n=1 Tax=Russula ochroleuca TaxID=152965 RepID=A0A9P5MY90_9AGAM|nr:hypothetical protein DFH94DRAFT_825446 [Russula ochroleuca]